MRKTPTLGYIAMIISCLILFSACSKKKEKEVPVGKVIKGEFVLEIYEEGEVEAIRSINISAPNISWRYGNLKMTHIIKDGTEVKTGDTLLVFDPSEVKKGVVVAEGRLGMNKAQLQKLIAQQQSDLEELKADYEVNRINQEISKIRFESAGYEANVKKKEIELNLQKANIALARAKEQIDNRIKIQKEEQKQQNLSINQDVTELAEANETLRLLYLISPSNGIAVVNRNYSTGNKYQVGDQCWPGSPLIQLPDLTSLKATVKINEVDISKIRKGQVVEIRPDAFSNTIFKGEVNSVANLAVNKDDKSKVKVFPVEILITGNIGKLLPGLTVNCRIIIGKIKDALYVPLVAVQSEGAVDYVYKVTSKGYEKTKVETGASNADFIIITKGLEVGDKIAMADPTKKEEKKDTKKTSNKKAK